MNTFADIVSVPSFSGTEAGFYSVRRKGNYELDEFSYWQQTFSSHPKIKDEYVDLVNWLSRFGSELGTLEKYFRPEGLAKALPPPVSFLEVSYTYHLRLYCFRVSDQLTFLFNGGIKSKPGDVSRTAQASPVERHFKLANEFSDELSSLLESGVLKAQATKLICTDGSVTIHN